MTLLAGHELATGLATLAALLAVLTGGQLNPVAWAALLLVPAAPLLKRRGMALSTAAGGLLALGAVLFGVVFTAREGVGSILLGAAYSLFLLVCVRLLNRDTPAHDLQLYALSLLLILDAAALNVSWLYAPCFLGYTVSIVWALTTRELKRAAQDDHHARHGGGEAPIWFEPGVLKARFFASTGAIALVVLVGTLSLFVVFPRVGLGMLRLPGAGKVSGFSTSVSLGGGGGISQDPTVIMRVRPVSVDEETPLANLYFRGAAFDHWDGNTWSRTAPAKADSKPFSHMPRPAPGQPLHHYRVQLQPMGVPYLFSAGAVGKVSVLPGARVFGPPQVPFRDLLGDLQIQVPSEEVVEYEVEAALLARPNALPEIPATAELPQMPADYLDVSGVSARAQELAKTWTANAVGPYEKVAAIQAALGAFAYSREDEAPPFGVTALDHFLFTRHAGHCEYYATAMALLSRAVGVPARMVGGYQGGAFHEGTGTLLLRQMDAHAWAEVFVPGTGWWPMDAAPGAVLVRPSLGAAASFTESLQQLWEEYVVDFDLGVQVQAAQSMAAMLAALRSWSPKADASQGTAWWVGVLYGVLAVLLAGLAWRLRRRLQAQAVPGMRLARVLEESARRAGVGPVESNTVRDWLQRMRDVVDAQALAALENGAAAYERARFGGAPLPAAEERELVAEIERFMRQGRAGATQR